MTVDPAVSASDNVNVATGVFAIFVMVALVIVYRVSQRRSSTNDFYVADGRFTGSQNGMALVGGYLSAASFLGVTGAIAIGGYSGFVYSVGFLAGWLINQLLIAEPLHNTGRFTMGDVLSFRMRQRPVRIAAAISTVMISLLSMLAQMAGTGALIALLLDLHSKSTQSLVIAGLGVIMIIYVLIGGMRGLTWVQIIKAGLLLTTVVLIAIFLLGKFGFSVSLLLDKAEDISSPDTNILDHGRKYSGIGIARLDLVSLALASVLGGAGLPHVLMRFYTVPNAKEARRSASWAVWLMLMFLLSVLVLGYAASALVGSSTIEAAPGGENSAVPLLAFHIGGTALLGVVSAVVFVTILAVVAGLMLTASASFSHDVYANVFHKDKMDTRTEVRVARITTVVIGVLAIVGGVLASGQNVAFLVAIALACAASANLPALLLSLFWKRFNTAGTLCGIYGGLLSCLTLVIFSPVVSGAKTSILPNVDFHWFPLSNPGIVSIPFSLVCAVIGTLVGKDRPAPELQAEMEVRTMTGIGR